MSKNIKVLVAGSGNVTGMNVIRALLMDNINVIGCDYNKHNPADMLCINEVVPKCIDILYIESIKKIIKKHNITHVIPSNDHDLNMLSLNAKELQNMGVKLNGFSKNTLTCLDKIKTTNLFIEKNILTPLFVESVNDFPYVLRIAQMGKKQKFVHIIRNEHNKKSIDVDEFNDGVITRFIEGKEYTIDVLCDESSDVISAIPRLRVVVKGGIVHYAEIVKNDQLLEKIREMCKTLSLKGINCVQCIENSCKFYFIEINPRPGSGIDLSVNAGINMPALWVKGNYNNVLIPNWNLKMYRYYDGYFFE